MIRRYRNLDGLRGICALQVLAFHINWMTAHHDLGHLGLAVNMFFMISGFVIALNYEHMLQNGMSFSKFIFKRSRRLLPVYWMGTALCIIISIWWIPEITPKEFLILSTATAFFIPLLAPETALEFICNSPAWSLFAEWGANIFYSAGLYKLTIAKLLSLSVILYVGTIVSGMFLPYAWHRIGIFRFGVIPATAEFCAGVILFRYYKYNSFNNTPYIKPEITMALWSIILLLPIMFGNSIYNAAITIIACPLTLILLLRSEAYAPKWCAAVGRLSYPLYASHMAIIMLVQSFFSDYLNRYPHPLIAIASGISALALAWCIAWANDRIQERIRRPVAADLPTTPNLAE